MDNHQTLTKHMNPTITQEFIKKARENGISYATVYRRIKKGWTIEKATTVPTEYQQRKKKRSVLFNVKRGRLRSFRLPVTHDKEFDLIAQKYGLTVLDLASEIITKHLENNDVEEFLGKVNGENYLGM